MAEHPTVHPIPPPAFDSPFGSEISDAPSAMATVEELQQRLQELAAENARLAAAAQPNPHPPAQPATQVFGKPPKIPEPTTFNGNSNDIDRFVDQVKFWTDPCLSDQHRIRLTATRLVSHAAAWHLQYGSDHQVYSEYLEALAIYFQDPRRHERAVRQLLELKQGKSVADYNRSFTSIGLRFAADRKWPEQVLIDIYLNGLSSTVRAHVEASQRPTTLEAAQRAAIVAAGAAALQQPAGPPASSSTSRSVTSSATSRSATSSATARLPWRSALCSSAATASSSSGRSRRPAGPGRRRTGQRPLALSARRRARQACTGPLSAPSPSRRRQTRRLEPGPRCPTCHQAQQSGVKPWGHRAG